MHGSKGPSAGPCRGPLWLWAAPRGVVAWVAIANAVNRLACSAWRDDSVTDAPGAARASSTGVVMSADSGREPDKNPLACARDDGAAQHASSSSAKPNRRGASARLGCGAARWDLGSALLCSARHGSSTLCVPCLLRAPPSLRWQRLRRWAWLERVPGACRGVSVRLVAKQSEQLQPTTGD